MLPITLLLLVCTCLAGRSASDGLKVIEYPAYSTLQVGGIRNGTSMIEVLPLGLSNSMEGHMEFNCSVMLDLDSTRNQLSPRHDPFDKYWTTRTGSFWSFSNMGLSSYRCLKNQNSDAEDCFATTHIGRVLSLWLYFAGSLFFDIAHYALHIFSKSKYRILRKIGYLHEVHHLYFNRRLKFNPRYLWQNMALELPLELGCQLFGTFLGYLAAHMLNLTGPGLLSWELFTLVMAFEIIRSFVVVVLEGRDSNHKTYVNIVPKDPNTFLVGPEFHAMHHVDPSAYISSSFRVFDWFLGTSYTLRSRRITVIGASEGLSGALKKTLERESVSCIQELKFEVDWTHEVYLAYIETLTNTDILVLSHGSEDETHARINCECAVGFIELFKAHRKPKSGSLLLPEIWYFGSELQTQPTIRDNIVTADREPEREFVRHARKYYDDEDVVYRHVAAPSISLGVVNNSLVDAEAAVGWAMWWIKRGARFVPPTCTMSALLSWFKFLYWAEKAP